MFLNGGGGYRHVEKEMHIQVFLSGEGQQNKYNEVGFWEILTAYLKKEWNYLKLLCVWPVGQCNGYLMGPWYGFQADGKWCYALSHYAWFPIDSPPSHPIEKLDFYS